MKFINEKNLLGVDFLGGKSYRSVVKKHNMGFALMKTVIRKGGPYLWHYRNHLEACYCISGKGYVKDLSTGEVFNVSKGITYLVDNNQPHEFTALTNVVLVSVFNPPLVGHETHDEQGNYN